MIEKLDSATLDKLLSTGELTEAQIEMIGQMYSSGAKTSEIVAAVLDER